MKVFRSWLLMVVMFSSLQLNISATEILTNNKVLTKGMAGLGEDVIVDTGSTYKNTVLLKFHKKSDAF